MKPLLCDWRDLQCPVCGGPARHFQREDLLTCRDCQAVRDPAELEAALLADARRWWRGLDDFTKGILRESRATLALKRVAVRLLEAGIAPAIVEQIALALNDRLPRPALAGDVEDTLVEAAQIIARRRARRGVA